MHVRCRSMHIARRREYGENATKNGLLMRILLKRTLLTLAREHLTRLFFHRTSRRSEIAPKMLRNKKNKVRIVFILYLTFDNF